MKYILFILFLLATPAAADDAAISYGKALAETNCARCHAIANKGQSPLDAAPPFRDIAVNYDIEELEDALNEGVPTEHPVMPDWQMTPEQAHALASFIMSLGPAGKQKSETAPNSQPGLADNP